jgi:signal transduction histidine kinase
MKIDHANSWWPAIADDVSEAKKLITEAHKKNIVLHATSVDLQQKIRQLQEFNSIIAHNLCGPATALIDSTELLGDVHDDKVRRTLPNI